MKTCHYILNKWKGYSPKWIPPNMQLEIIYKSGLQCWALIKIISIVEWILGPCISFRHCLLVNHCSAEFSLIISKSLLMPKKSPILSSCLPQFSLFLFTWDEQIIKGHLRMQTHYLFSHYRQTHITTRHLFPLTWFICVCSWNGWPGKLSTGLTDSIPMRRKNRLPV